MTSSDRELDRLKTRLELQPGGTVHIVIVDSSTPKPLLAGSVGAGLLGFERAPSVAQALADKSTEAVLEIDLTTGPISDHQMREWNRQREQFRRDKPVILRVSGEQAARLCRIAPDLWKWAQVTDLSSISQQQIRLTPVFAQVDPDAYAPALQPDSVRGPAYPLTARDFEEGDG